MTTPSNDPLSALLEVTGGANTLIHLAPGRVNPGHPHPLAPAMAERLRVWRARRGELITVRAADGGYWRGRLVDDDSVIIIEPLPATVEPPAPRIVAQAVPERERMLWLLQKVVELGATAIHPLTTDRSTTPERLKQDKRATWERIVVQAARQCRRGIIPELHPCLEFDRFVATLDPGTARAIFLDVTPGTALPHLLAALAGERSRPLVLMVGPEGGWSERERRLLVTAGCRAASLGGRVLRTESAAPTALAWLEADQHLAG